MIGSKALIPCKSLLLHLNLQTIEPGVGTIIERVEENVCGGSGEAHGEVVVEYTTERAAGIHDTNGLDPAKGGFAESIRQIAHYRDAVHHKIIGAGAAIFLRDKLQGVLFRPVENIPVIGTFELNGWSFQSGEYTAVGGTATPAKGTFLSVAPGVRLVVCDKIDCGITAAIALTEVRLASTLIRSEVRWRY